VERSSYLNVLRLGETGEKNTWTERVEREACRRRQMVMRNQLRLYSQRLLSNALVTGAHDTSSAVNFTTLKALYNEVTGVRSEQRTVADAVAELHREMTKASALRLTACRFPASQGIADFEAIFQSARIVQILSLAASL
jgi:hypothetical protein